MRNSNDTGPNRKTRRKHNNRKDVRQAPKKAPLQNDVEAEYAKVKDVSYKRLMATKRKKHEEKVAAKEQAALLRSQDRDFLPGDRVKTKDGQHNFVSYAIHLCRPNEPVRYYLRYPLKSGGSYCYGRDLVPDPQNRRWKWWKKKKQKSKTP